jgi:hypothetical protein
MFFFGSTFLFYKNSLHYECWVKNTGGNKTVATVERNSYKKVYKRGIREADETLGEGRSSLLPQRSEFAQFPLRYPL